MALTPYQRDVCRLIAAARRDAGESYVAGGAALNALTSAPRLSRDVDVFHDTSAAVAASWDRDRTLLVDAGHTVKVVRERPAYVEATVSRDGRSVVLQWAPDSAFRFFPLVEHEDFGLVLHPFDLATNKVLALVGRLEPRDWVDVITCHDRIQPLGLLAWAACGKDPGFSPFSILDHAGRSARYTDVELRALSFEGEPPSAADLSMRFRTMLEEARGIVATLPASEAGKAVLREDGTPFVGGAADVRAAAEAGSLRFHPGSIRGALPRLTG